MFESTDFSALFEKFKNQKVLVIGDVMIDTYLWGNVSRVSPEAPVPIVSGVIEENRLGGAANVVLVVLQRNLCGFAHRLEAGEVNDCVDFFTPEQKMHGGRIAQVGQVELDILSGEFLDPAQGVGF